LMAVNADSGQSGASVWRAWPLCSEGPCSEECLTSYHGVMAPGV
jgi:hypothetical protein